MAAMPRSARASTIAALLRRNRWRCAASWSAMPWWIANRRAALCYHGRGLAYDLVEGAPFSTAYAWAHRLHCDVHDKFYSTRSYWRFYGPGLSDHNREMERRTRGIPF